MTNHLRMERGEAINKVRAYRSLLKSHFQLEGVYLYGSHAQGTQNDESTIDVAVVVDRVRGDYFAVSPLLWKLKRQVDKRIEPILIEKDFDEAGLLKEVRKNGIEIV